MTDKPAGASERHESLGAVGSQVERGVRPLFAAAVARRKWEELQDAGHRMQRLYFQREDGSAGNIDAWGVVTWTRPNEPSRPRRRHDMNEASKHDTPTRVGLSEGLGPAPERAEWVRAWFAKRYADSGVFGDGAEALTLEAACQLVADAQAAERACVRAAEVLKLTAPQQPAQGLSDSALIGMWGMRSDGPSNAEILSFGRQVERACLAAECARAIREA